VQKQSLNNMKYNNFKRFTLLIACIFYIVVAANQLFAATYNVVVASNGSGDVKTVQEAFDKVPSNNANTFTIFVKKGTYKQKVKLTKGKNNVVVIGEDVATTIMTFDDYGAKAGSTSGSYSTLIEADNFTAQNITFENTIDSRLSQYSSGGQAVSVNVTGDKVSFYNCVIKGFQDTFYNSGKGRVYTKCSTIKGTTDFIFGSGVNIFEDCIIVNMKSSATTAASNKNVNNKYNYLFMHCELKAEGNISCTLGRPWGAQARVVFYECIEGSHIKAEGWQNWSSADYSKTAYFAEYKCTGAGAKTSGRISWSHQLTTSEAAIYTITKMFAKNANADSYSSDWIPVAPAGACGSVVTAIEESSSIQEVSIYPNPSNSGFKIEFPEATNLQLFDLAGTIIEEHRNVLKATIGQNLHSGTYLLKVGSKMYRLIKD
jgi:pectinesterase